MAERSGAGDHGPYFVTVVQTQLGGVLTIHPESEQQRRDLETVGYKKTASKPNGQRHVRFRLVLILGFGDWITNNF